MLTTDQLRSLAKTQALAQRIGTGSTAALVVLGVAVGVLGWLFNWGVGFAPIVQALLTGWVLWFTLAIGCLGTIMVHHLCGGSWSFVIQRFCEAGARTLPFLCGAGAVIILGGAYTGVLYPWTLESYKEAFPIVREKEALLNLPVFTLAYFALFGIWIALTNFYTSRSLRLDQTGDLSLIQPMRTLAGPGLIIYVLSLTFAATLWLMSLEPEWFSTIFGAWLIASSALTTIAFCGVVLSYFVQAPPLSEQVTARQVNHLGNFLLGFTIFWSYFSFSQYLIIWNGNLPEVIGWYLHRNGGGMTVLTVLLVVLHWFFPMMYLLIRRSRTRAESLRFIAGWLLFARLLDVYWNVVPSFERAHSYVDPYLTLLVALAMAGIGGLWISRFCVFLKQRPLLPQHDPRGELFALKDEAHGHA